MTVINLTEKRVDRLEKTLGETNQLLHDAVKILHDHSEALEELRPLPQQVERLTDLVTHLTERMDRFIASILVSRTNDASMFADIRRRLHAMEQKSPRTKKPKPKRT